MNVPKLRFSEFSENYKKIKLKNMTKLITKGTTPRKYTDSGVNFIKVENLLDNQIKNINSYISYETHNNELKRSILKEYDILFSIAGALGRTAIVTKEELPANTNQACSIIRLDNLNDYNLYYLMERLHHFDIKSYINKCQSVGAQPNLSLEQVGNICINIPNKKEQDRVGRLIELVNKKIELQTKKIEALKLFKKGLVTILFNDLKNFKKCKLGALCNITTGKLDANAMRENGKYRFYTCAKDYSFIDSYAFDTEALLISGNGAYVGYIHYYKGKFNAYQRTYVLNNFTQNVQFIKCYLEQNLSKRINSEKKEGNTPYIVLSTLSDMIIKIPNKEEQIKISNIINYYNSKIELENKKLVKLYELKKGFMQSMFV